MIIIIKKIFQILKRKICKQEWKLDRNKFIILMPGRLTYWKGQENFIESLNIVNKELYNISFLAIILGSDQGRNVYKKN